MPDAPKDPPVISTTPAHGLAGSIITVQSNHGIEFMCTVDGGKPKVSFTRFVCDGDILFVNGTWQRNHSAHGDTVRVYLTVTERFDDVICYCTADHVTDQYFLYSNVTFKLVGELIGNLFFPCRCQCWTYFCMCANCFKDKI